MVGKGEPYHNILKEAYCLSCYRERRNFSNGARMASGSHAYAWAAIPITSPTGIPTTIYKSVAIQFTLLFYIVF